MEKRTPEDTQKLKKLGRKIVAFRKQKGYPNYEDFAYKKNIARAQMGRYENGESDIRYTTLLKVIQALGMTPAEFFSDDTGQ